jgi:hypothetical protein
LTHSYSTKECTDIAKKVIINNPKYMNMKDNQDDANSLYFWLDCCSELPGRDGALVRQMRHWLALNAPGLLDRIPPPATFERRGREVKQELRDNQQIQPGLES